MKICLVVAELFRADRRTDRQNEANGHSSQFCSFTDVPTNFSVHDNFQISPVYFRNSIKIKEISIKIAIQASQQTKSRTPKTNNEVLCRMFLGCLRCLLWEKFKILETGNERTKIAFFLYQPFPTLHRTSSDSMIFQFCSDVGRRPTRFLLRLFARCRSLSDAFPHVVRTLTNR
jgi:hypothetical protein